MKHTPLTDTEKVQAEAVSRCLESSPGDVGANLVEMSQRIGRQLSHVALERLIDLGYVQKLSRDNRDSLHLVRPYRAAQDDIGPSGRFELWLAAHKGTTVAETNSQIAENIDCTDRTVRRLLATAIAAGKAERIQATEYLPLVGYRRIRVV